jgi:hypothetical protein
MIALWTIPKPPHPKNPLNSMHSLGKTISVFSHSGFGNPNCSPRPLSLSENFCGIEGQELAKGAFSDSETIKLILLV